MNPLITNDYAIKDSFSFAKEVLELDASCFTASFDIKSLSNNIPLTETLTLCVQNLYRNQRHVKNLIKSSFYKLLKITMFKSFYIFHGKFYEQCDGVAIGSPLGPTLANFFMCHFETFGWKTARVISNQLFIDGLLMIHFYYFDQRITLRNLEIISINSIKA